MKLFDRLRTISWQQVVVLVALIASVAFTAHALPARLWDKILDSSPQAIAGWITTVGLALLALAAQARAREVPAPDQTRRRTLPPPADGYTPPPAVPGPSKLPRDAPGGYRDDVGEEVDDDEREDPTPRLGTRGRRRGYARGLLLVAIAVLGAAALVAWGMLS